ncbi:hypothetical protein G7077_03555 [Sphingomonas piscis]|uniref:TonB C-terminal domain-containing protein n=1 Tax=Sphingomonas piscis TaxID=2714943 RepID=A0A6G7YN03_9SPHN|nr:energy transducer TonB [Sphingomonas piscis]QIK78125.1 hypothetical protein G7077_03555 [Sphingomonas piscis]
MASYRGTANGQDKAKAAAAVLLVHAGLAALILTGLNPQVVHRTISALKTFDVRPDVPPPPPPPPPQPARSSPAKEAEGIAGKKAEPSPIVLPEQRVPLPVKPPLQAASVAGSGSASNAGAAAVGEGPGAGNNGSGRGGGGIGGRGPDYSKFTPVQRISRIPNREYRRLVAASGRDFGTVGLTLKVNTDGNPSNCRIVRTSGDRSVDALMCQLALSYIRFRPARDDRGRPVAQDYTWFPDWSPY